VLQTACTIGCGPVLETKHPWINHTNSQHRNGPSSLNAVRTLHNTEPAGRGPQATQPTELVQIKLSYQPLMWGFAKDDLTNQKTMDV